MILSLKKLTLFVFAIAALASCGGGDDDYTPKPKGYFRIDFPEKIYTQFDSTCPFTFEYPAYARVVPDRDKLSEPCWLNVNFPQFKAQLHLSYKLMKDDLGKYLEDSRTLAVRHTIKASGIEELPVIRDSSNVYGLIYSIEGNAASSVQFYLTDSTNHFIRGALYFNTRPNKDSLGIVVDFIREDIHHLIQSFEWKGTGKK